MTILVTKANNNNIYNYRRPLQNCSDKQGDDGDASVAAMDATSAVLAVTNESESDHVASQLIQAQHNPQIIDLSFHRTNIDPNIFDALRTLMLQRAADTGVHDHSIDNGADNTDQSHPSHSTSPPWHTISLINCEGLVQETLDLILSLDCLRSLHLGFDAGDDVASNAPDNNAQCRIPEIATLTRWLSHSSHLKSLRITATMHAGDVAELGQAIGSNKSLTLLDLSWSCFVEPRLETELDNTHRHHDTTGNPEHISIIHHLAGGFRRNTSLRTLDLYGCNLSDHQMTIILHSLVQHPTLQSLALNDNKCGSKASLAASDVLCHPECLVQKFVLSFQRVADKAASASAATPPAADINVATNVNANANVAADHGATNDGSAATTTALATRTDTSTASTNVEHDANSATTLVPSPGRLNIAALARAIQYNPSSLVSLDLSSCDLLDADAVYLARAIHSRQSVPFCDAASSPALQELVLSRNKITNIGIRALARSLHHCSSDNNAANSKQDDTYMVCRPIGSGVLQNLPEPIHRCQRCRVGLRRLSVWGNPFDEAGAEELLAALRNNTELETLDLFREFKCSKQIRHLLNMNRVGRRFLRHTNDGSAIYQDRSAVSVPIGLWAHVLARCNKVKLVQRSENIEQERAHIMFDFLRESPHLYQQ